MLLPSLLALISLVASGSPSAGGSVHGEPRIGLRVSGGDLSPEIGLGVEAWVVGVTADLWVRPFRWVTEVQESPTKYYRYDELRYGSTLGARLRTPGPGAWVAVSGGWEAIAGDWAGTRASPETQMVPWFGLEAKSSSSLLGRVRFATESNRLGWVRVEVLGAFSIPGRDK